MGAKIAKRDGPPNEIVFFKTLWRASKPLTGLWWTLLFLGGVLPAAFAVASGVLIGAVENDTSLTGPLVLIGVIFVTLQVVNPLHDAIGSNLGHTAASWMNDRLLTATTQPPGMAHLERPDLADDITMARDFDLGISGPPLHISMGFISVGLVKLVAGTASAIVLLAFSWWAPLVLVVAWGSTHVLLRESGVWKDRNTDEVRKSQRHADYAYRLAVDAPAAKEMRLFGLADWVVERFMQRRRHLHDLQWEATRLRQRSIFKTLAIVVAANGLVFWRLADAVIDARIDLAEASVYFQTAIGTSAIAFGGLSWALDAAAAPAVAVSKLPPVMAEAGALSVGSAPAAGLPASEIRFRDLTFTYEAGSVPVLENLELTIPAGSSLAIVGQNGAGKTTLAKLLCRFYDPDSGTIEIDGTDLRELDLGEWRERVQAVFQDFVRHERSLRDNVAPGGAEDADILAALVDAGGEGLADLDTILAKGYPNGTELSGGQWQRVALARALCGVRLGAGVVLLDEPTAQLDVRGEAEIFERLLEATRDCTTVLVSHRFSTVRHADQIAVIEDGHVIELGSHEELMALDGRYRTMYDLQASRFAEVEAGNGTDGNAEQDEVTYETL
jgi:ATP-binding cassette subfamily B protein